LVKADIGVLEIRRRKRELESVFLRLIGSGGDEAAPEKGTSENRRGAEAATRGVDT
jgi:hypothetical protein